MCETPSWSDLLRELTRQKFVVLWIQLVQILWHWLHCLVVQRAERNSLVRVSKNLNSLTRGLLNDLRLVIFSVLNRLLLRYQLGARVVRCYYNLVRHIPFNRRCLERLQFERLLFELFKLLCRFESLKM
jgi:hypothetical protein